MAKPKLPTGMVRRGNVYWGDFQHKGQRVRKRLSGDLKVATSILNELRGRLERGEYGLLDNAVPIADVRREYMAHLTLTRRPGTVQRVEHALDRIIPNMPAKVAAVSAVAITSYRERRLADGLSPRTVNIETGALTRLRQQP